MSGLALLENVLLEGLNLEAAILLDELRHTIPGEKVSFGGTDVNHAGATIGKGCDDTFVFFERRTEALCGVLSAKSLHLDGIDFQGAGH